MVRVSKEQIELYRQYREEYKEDVEPYKYTNLDIMFSVVAVLMLWGVILNVWLTVDNQIQLYKVIVATVMNIPTTAIFLYATHLSIKNREVRYKTLLKGYQWRDIYLFKELDKLSEGSIIYLMNVNKKGTYLLGDEGDKIKEIQVI